MFHDEVALQCSYSPVSIVCWEQNNLKICTYKRAANIKKSLYPAGVAFSVFIVEHFYQYRSSQTTNSQNILSSQLTFLSNPPFVHSSAPAQLTLTRCPLRIVSTGNLLFFFMPTAVNTTNMLLFPFAVQNPRLLNLCGTR